MSVETSGRLQFRCFSSVNSCKVWKSIRWLFCVLRFLLIYFWFKFKLAEFFTTYNNIQILTRLKKIDFSYRHKLLFKKDDTESSNISPSRTLI